MKKLLFYLARSNVAAVFIGLAFEYFHFLIPVKKIYENKSILIFEHPVPFCETHYLLVPKLKLKELYSIDFKNQNHRDFILQIFCGTKIIKDKLNIEDIFLVVNSGKYQDVPQIHFHLMRGRCKNSRDYVKDSNFTFGEIIYEVNAISIFRNSTPYRDLDLLVSSRLKTSSGNNLIYLFEAALDYTKNNNIHNFSIFIKYPKIEKDGLTLNILGGTHI